MLHKLRHILELGLRIHAGSCSPRNSREIAQSQTDALCQGIAEQALSSTLFNVHDKYPEVDIINKPTLDQEKKMNLYKISVVVSQRKDFD